MTDPADAMRSGIDRPRPLPPALRARLEDQLLQATEVAPAMPLGEELEQRLEATLADPVGTALLGVDAPRPLPPRVRAGLERRLLRPRRPAFLGAAAAIVLVVALAVAVATHGGGTRRPEAGPAAETPASTSAGSTGATGASAGVAAGTGAVGSGKVTDSVTTPVPSPAAGAAAGGPMAASGSAGGDPVEVTSVSPDAGPLAGGTTVRLQGRGLAPTAGVWFGDRPATSYHVGSDDVVTAVTPAVDAAAVVDVVLRLRTGVTYRLNAAFRYLARPSVSGISPSSGSTGGGTWVTVHGAALGAATSVSFGGTTATRVEVLSDSRLRALSPSHLPGPVDVTVSTPGGSSATTGADRFTYLP
jgi:hypothetical protein